MQPRTRLWAARAATVLVVSVTTTRAADDAEGVERAPDPAAVVRSLVEREAAILDVESLRIRLDVSTTRSERAIAASRAELAAKYPPEIVTPKRFTELRPEVKETVELAFDGERLRSVSDRHGVAIETAIWDGRYAWRHTRYRTHEQEGYAIDDTPHDNFALIHGLDWLRVGAHSFWWNTTEMQVGGITFYRSAVDDQWKSDVWGEPDEYLYGGRATFRGRECHALDLPTLFPRRLWVSVDDGVLLGETHYRFSPYERGREVLRELFGAEVDSFSKFSDWLETLSSDERQEARRRCMDALIESASRTSEWFCDDYREVTAGLVLPHTFGYAILDDDEDGEVYVATKREARIAEIEVDGELPDELFALEIRDGVRVVDMRMEPPLIYTSKSDRSAFEWRAIFKQHEEAARRREDERKRRDALIGEAAPMLPETGWVNSEALTWKDLRGRVVVLDFCAHWCAPCRNDYPFLQKVHEGRKRSGISVIGVHTPTSDAAVVREMVREFDMGFPVVIDDPKPADSHGFGRLSSWFHVRAIPFAVVIDRDGRVAGHGSLDDAMAKARELTAARETTAPDSEEE